MSLPIDDILDYFKARGVDVLDTSVDAHSLIKEHWPAMAEDVGLKAHGKVSGSIAAALASELVYAERELVACENYIRIARSKAGGE